MADMRFKQLAKRLVSLMFLLILHGILYAQDSVLNSIDNPPEPESTGTSTKLPLSRLEFSLSIIVLSFGIIVILLEIFVIKSKKIASQDVIKFITITLIITGTLFLITAGYDNNQIAPAVGLLGTIAGYLLGRINNSRNEDQNESTT
jgi:hypothetical protein